MCIEAITVTQADVEHCKVKSVHILRSRALLQGKCRALHLSIFTQAGKTCSCRLIAVAFAQQQPAGSCLRQQPKRNMIVADALHSNYAVKCQTPVLAANLYPHRLDVTVTIRMHVLTYLSHHAFTDVVEALKKVRVRAACQRSQQSAVHEDVAVQMPSRFFQNFACLVDQPHLFPHGQIRVQQTGE
jgi:hypothetical protein